MIGFNLLCDVNEAGINIKPTYIPSTSATGLPITIPNTQVANPFVPLNF